MFVSDPLAACRGVEELVELPASVVALEQALQALSQIDLAALGGAELRVTTQALCRLQGTFEQARLAVVAQLDASCAFVGDGSLTAGAWIGRHTPLDADAGRRDARVAKRLRDCPGTAAALAAGDVSPGAAAVIADGAAVDPVAFAAVEDAVVEAARSCPRRSVRDAMRYWRDLLRSDGSLAAEVNRQRDQRGLSVSETLDGMVVLDGLFDPIDGAELLGLLRSVDQHLFRADRDGTSGVETRGARQRRADALMELLRAGGGALARGVDGHRVPGCSTSTTVVVRAEHLQALEQLLGSVGADVASQPSRRSAVHAPPLEVVLGDHTAVLDRESARFLTCDTTLRALVVGPHDEPLELGRTVRTATPSQRTALAVRDKGCVFTGCDRPVGWCDAHHILHWEHGGPTDLANLACLCRRHHRLIHSPGWAVRIESDGHATISFLGVDQPRNTHPPPLGLAA